MGQLNFLNIDYNPSVNSNVSMGSINQALIPGSSGSIINIVSSSEKILVGMISCQGDEYQNMTLVVPIATINAVIDRSNFDNNGIKYYHLFLPTSPNPTSGYMLYIPTSDVKEIDMSSEEAIKIIISGGALSPKENQID